MTFNNHTGIAWFDDIRLAEYEVSLLIANSVPTLSFLYCKITSSFKLGLRLLILSVSESDIRVEAAKKALDAVGALYQMFN